MCFALYVGANITLPKILVNESNPSVHTESLNENDRSVVSHFSTQNVIYFGSTEGCGCGFRHALLENSGDEWMPIEYEQGDLTDDQINMLGLHSYLKNIINSGEKAELYGIWDGDYNMEPLFKQELPIDDLLNTNFCFKERGFYTIKL